MRGQEFLEERTQNEATGAQSAHEALLERYLHRLQASPTPLADASPSGREHTLQWAIDELKHTAATLGELSLEDAEYELEHVLQEVMERLR